MTNEWQKSVVVTEIYYLIRYRRYEVGDWLQIVEHDFQSALKAYNKLEEQQVYGLNLEKHTVDKYDIGYYKQQKQWMNN